MFPSIEAGSNFNSKNYGEKSNPQEEGINFKDQRIKTELWKKKSSNLGISRREDVWAVVSIFIKQARCG